jgi:signal transduction histidine kinase/ligand-binding sensor domain-containing protein
MHYVWSYVVQINKLKIKPMRRFFSPLLSMLLLLSVLTVWASPTSVRFERLSIEHGLSQNTVTSIKQDRKGFIWFGTQDGLNRYDGYEFKVFRHDPQAPFSLSDNYVSAVFEDSKGVLWIGTRNGGLNKYDASLERFEHFTYEATKPGGLSQNSVRVIFEDSLGALWVGTEGGLNRFDGQNFTRFEHQPSVLDSLSHNVVSAIEEDSQGRLWVGTIGGGLNRLNRQKQGFVHYRHDSANPLSLSNDRIDTIVEDSRGQLWIGTDNKLNHFNSTNGHFVHYSPDSENPYSISHEKIRVIHEDAKGVLWIGTWGGGVSRLDEKRQRFSQFRYDSSDLYGLSGDLVRSIYEDDKGVIWIGTRAGVNKYDTKRERFGHFSHNPSDPQSLSHDMVKSFFEDADGTLWIGTDGGGLNEFDVKQQDFTRHSSPTHNSNSDRASAVFVDAQWMLWLGTFGTGLTRYNSDLADATYFKHLASDASSLSDNNVSVIYEDKSGVIWVGTWGGGLNRFNVNEADFSHFRYNPADPQSLSHNTIKTIFEDSNGNLWIGTSGGLNKLNRKTGRFKRFKHDKTNAQSLSHNNVMSIYQSRRGVLWLGTFGGGLNRFDVQSEQFVHYREKDGLANDSVYGILGDDEGYLWLSTNQGLSKFDPKTKSFRNYDVNDGLQSNEFNRGAYFRSKNGALNFGGINGFNRFFAKDIKLDSEKPKVVFTDFLLFNQSTPIVPEGLQDDGIYRLPKAIGSLKALSLSYKESLVTFEFSALDFTNPGKNQYAYKLEGLDDNWIKTDAKNRRATYTHIPPGNYTLEVKASNADGVWNEQGASIRILVAPPPWNAWWAWTIYGLIIVALVMAFIRAQRNKVNYAYALNRQLKQVDKLKDEFLANTSHELRTPLNGIIGLAESLIDGVAGKLPDKANRNLAMVVSSGKRLSNLVNDILDFSKLKNRNLVLHKTPVDLRSMVDVVLTLSSPLMGDKKLQLVNAVPHNMCAALADEDRLQQVFHNLIGNAIKFTDAGNVTVSTEVQDEQITITISDTGIGIAKDQFANIFESFEQVEGSAVRLYGGTGLGLAVSKQLVKLHGGCIKVESELGQGASFSFTLPTSDKQATTRARDDQSVALLHMLDSVEEEQSPIITTAEYHGSQFRILLVDDEPINRQVLNDYLSLQDYQLFEASDGPEALRAVEEKGPFDLILLDIMMPRMSGYEVCKKLRETHPVHDLPIIFLTAKNQVADLVQSFAVGANDYLRKPVAKHELLTRVETHLKLLDINRNLEQRVAERTTELVQSEKMASLGTLTAGVAHEINNPTNFVHVSAQNLRVDLARFQRFVIELAGDDTEEEVLENFRQQFKPLYEHLAIIKDGTRRIKTIVEDLHVFTQIDLADKKSVNINECLQSTLNLVKTKNRRTAQFVTDFNITPKLLCHPAQLNQVFMSLIVNACDAIRRKQLAQENDPDLPELGDQLVGKIAIKCGVLNQSPQQKIEITVTDDGCGMNEETKTKLFEPFFTTKTVGEGIGLGLSVAYRIVQKHGGTLVVDSEEGVGTVFRLTLPVLDEV